MSAIVMVHALQKRSNGPEADAGGGKRPQAHSLEGLHVAAERRLPPQLRTCYATDRLQRMRLANIVTGIIAALWSGLFLMGRDLIHGVYLQGYRVAPNAGQVDYYVIYPLVAVVLLLFSGWTANIWRKPVIALVPAFLIGFAILPFLFGYTGGM